MSAKDIYYSDKYEDDEFEYRWVEFGEVPTLFSC